MSDNKEMSEEQLDQDTDFVKISAKQILEAGKFDSVLVLTTKCAGTSTAKIRACIGNLYAANWSAKEYVIEQENYCIPKQE